jgi:hypothetical protein
LSFFSCWLLLRLLSAFALAITCTNINSVVKQCKNKLFEPYLVCPAGGAGIVLELQCCQHSTVLQLRGPKKRTHKVRQ